MKLSLMTTVATLWLATTRATQAWDCSASLKKSELKVHRRVIDHPKRLMLTPMKSISTALAFTLMASVSLAQAQSLIEISDVKIRHAEMVNLPGTDEWKFVFNVKNQSKKRVKAAACLRFYDKDSFEVENQSLGTDYNLAPNATDTVSGIRYLTRKETIQVVSVKVYPSRYGCADNPSEAIGEVIEIKFK
jgi:hypothetical protein